MHRTKRMPLCMLLLSVLVIAILVGSSCGAPAPTPTPYPTPTPIVWPTAVPTPTPIVWPTAVPTPTPIVWPTAVATPTPYPTPTPIVWPTPLPTATPIVWPTPLPTATPIPMPKPSGELRIALDYIGGENLDPTLAAASSRMYLDGMFDYIVGATPEGGLSKDTGLAYDWKIEHSATGSTYTFYLRDGVKFHNGDEATADDVKFTLEYLMRPASVTIMADTFRKVIDKIDVVDRYQVVVRTKKPYGTLVFDLSYAGYQDGMILPKKYIEEKGEKYFASHPVGSGPYKFKGQLTGSYIVLEAQDWHWRVGIPKYKTLRFQIVPEAVARIAMLKRGDADIINVPRENVKDVPGFPSFLKPGGDGAGIWFNGIWPGQDGPLTNERVREALNLAIDRESIVKYLLQGQGTVVGSHYYYSSLAIGYRPVPLYPYDPQRASQMLKEAWPQGVELTLYALPRPGVPEMPKIVEAVAAMWQAVGVKVKIVATDYATFIRPRLSLQQLTSWEAHGHAAGNRPFPALAACYSSTGVFRVVEDKTLDAMIDAATAEVDLDKLAELYFNIAMYIHDKNLNAPIAEVGTTFFSRPEKITTWAVPKTMYALNLDDLVTRK